MLQCEQGWRGMFCIKPFEVLSFSSVVKSELDAKKYLIWECDGQNLFVFFFLFFFSFVFFLFLSFFSFLFLKFASFNFEMTSWSFSVLFFFVCVCVCRASVFQPVIKLLWKINVAFSIFFNSNTVPFTASML